MHIVTDSAADLTPEEIAAFDIRVAPLLIQFPEGEVTSEALAADEFYDRLRAMAPAIPTTSQPSPGLFTDLYRAAGADDEAVLSIHISSGLSGTVGAARLAARTFGHDRVTVVDSMTLAGGLRYQVLAAAVAARAGWELSRILALLERICMAEEVTFGLDTLEYLAWGGRIGRVQALASTLLHIRPIIHVDKSDGKYSGAGRTRKVSDIPVAIVNHLEQLYGADTPLWATVQHGQRPDLAAAMTDQLQQRLNIARLDTLRVTPVLGVHTGPGIIGVDAVPIGLMRDVLRLAGDDI
jgi:DegV family protein with EDD domain